MGSERKIIFIITAVLLSIIIIAIIIPVSHSNIIKKNNIKSMKLEFTVSSSDPRVHMEIFFNLTEVVKDGNYTWDFGDGNYSYGSSVSHFYRRSNFFNVSVNALIEGNKLNSTKTLEVKLPDFYDEASDHNQRNYRIFIDESRGIGYEFEEGTTFPTFTVGMVVHNAFGKIRVYVSIVKQVGVAMNEEILYEEEGTYFFDEIRYEGTFYPEDLPDWERPYDLSCMVYIDDGQYDGWDMALRVTY